MERQMKDDELNDDPSILHMRFCNRPASIKYNWGLLGYIWVCAEHYDYIEGGGSSVQPLKDQFADA
jgi:hypothetical protein